MRAVTFNFDASAPATLKWIVDRDTILKGIIGSTQFAVSSDPNIDSNLSYAPTETGIIENFMLTGNSQSLPLDFPLSRGSEIYVQAILQGFVQLYLEDISAEI